MQEELQEEKVWGRDENFPHEEPVTSMCVGEYELSIPVSTRGG